MACLQRVARSAAGFYCAPRSRHSTTPKDRTHDCSSIQAGVHWPELSCARGRIGQRRAHRAAHLPQAAIEPDRGRGSDPASAQVEYEGEIGVIMGARASHVSERDAPRFVRGIAAFNDVTARDLQRTDSQWTRAKGFDTFAPMGAEFAQSSEWDGLTIVTRVNGVERQRAQAALMVFAIPLLIAFISSIMTLEPGDVIATGTPAGVGRLKPGDKVEVEILGPDA